MGINVVNEDKINPAHYGANEKGIQAIDIIELFDLNFAKGNVIKYTLRSGRKSEEGYDALTKEIEDLVKARWYIDREIDRLAAKKEQYNEVK
jgi:hypothetical protein